MNENSPSYYAIIPANVRYDSTLKANEKILYGELTALTNKTGECWASNKYFADLYDVTPQAVSNWISNLSKKGYISIEYIRKKDSQEIEKRIIKMVSINVIEVSTNVIGGINKCYRGYQQNFKENNTSINNTSINNSNNIINYSDISNYSNNSNYNNNINYSNNNNNIITYSENKKKEGESKKSYGEFKRVKLTDKEYNKLCEDFNKEVIDKQITLLDEYVESNNNKNKYSNFNLVLRKSIRENWFKNIKEEQPKKQQSKRRVF